ncbi:MAG: hypothetical protein JSU81_02135 [Candidatus Coatesbacteria bacterium]|nr:MAG: hypothetical protein JSU81_02135 [Candidatus Coatesbacteria bacterium]
MAGITYRPPTLDVRLRPRRRRRLYLWACAAITLALTLAFLYLWQYVTILELNYEVARCRRELDEAYQEKTALRSELYQRRSMAEIDEIAHDRLGLRPPVAGQIIIVEDGP